VFPQTAEIEVVAHLRILKGTTPSSPESQQLPQQINSMFEIGR